MFRSRLLLALLLAIGCLPQLTAAGEDVVRPNIVFFLIDDLGWTDLGCFGSTWYETPRIDALCASGMKFTDAYSNGPNCAPTRACLMSGQYTPRHGIYTVGTGARGLAKFRQLIPVDNKTTLDTDIVTLAESLQQAGYRTAHFGKWHLGSPPQAGPKAQGFDVNVGGNSSGSPQGGYFAPWKNKQMPAGKPSEYLTNRLTDEAVGFLEGHVKESAGQPFFAYLAHYAVHTPIQGEKELVEYFKDKPVLGRHSNATYAAMVKSVDNSVGRILDALDRLGVADNTVIVFTSDNGGLGGYQSMGLQKTSGVTDNSPLKGGKGALYEGGIRVSTFVVWPNVTEKGSTCDQPIVTLDFYPTLLEIARAEPPAGQLLDGRSIVPLLTGEADVFEDSRPVFWHFPGYLQGSQKHGEWRTTPGSVIRDGRYKLIYFYEGDQLELYDLLTDVGEQQNLAAEKPDVTRRLKGKLDRWRAEVNAQAPLPKR